jgi:hypothetical protein
MRKILSQTLIRSFQYTASHYIDYTIVSYLLYLMIMLRFVALKKLSDDFHMFSLTHWHTQPAVRRAEPSMTLPLILALCQ